MNHKPLVSSAPAHSILSAKFRYTNSSATDIRKTFARIRRDRAKEVATDNTASNVRPLVKKLQESAAATLALWQMKQGGH